jgi:hypothetical protein
MKNGKMMSSFTMKPLSFLRKSAVMLEVKPLKALQLQWQTNGVILLTNLN